MEGQGKRLLLAVALALGVMLVWNMVFPSKKADVKKPVPAAGSGTTPGSSAVRMATSLVCKSVTAEAPAPAAMGKPEPVEAPLTLTFPKFAATFSSQGGVLTSWQLSDPRFGKDATKGQLLPSTPNTGAFYVNFKQGSTYCIPETAAWKGTKVSDTVIKYTFANDQLEVEKTFTLDPEVFLVHMVVKITAKVPAGKEARQTLAYTAYAFQDPDHFDKGSSRSLPRAWTSSTLSDSTIHETPVADVIESPRGEVGIRWSGFEHPYLLAAYAPHFEGTETAEKQTFAGRGLEQSIEPRGLMRTDILMTSPLTFKAGDGPVTRELVAYLGPKNYQSLEAADANAGFSTGFKNTIDLGWFAFIGRPLLWLLLKFHAFFGNWGIAIILLTFLVKAATLYWTTKSMRSMKSMAALAPQMKVLQEKYKADRQRLQVETMALYKQHNVNPIAGCLPILLQMPIWLALYRMLSSAGELYQQPFIPGWIGDLTAPDPYYILPIVLVVTMFMQARLTPQTGTSGQQKMLQYGMPLMFGVMSFFFPAGLTLYIFTNTCLSALHSIYMNKFDKKSLEIAARMKANAEAAEAGKAEAAKPGGGGSKKNGLATKVAKPVIDVASVESAEGDDDADDSSATAGGSASSGPNAPRKRKKRRK